MYWDLLAVTVNQWYGPAEEHPTRLVLNWNEQMLTLAEGFVEVINRSKRTPRTTNCRVGSWERQSMALRCDCERWHGYLPRCCIA